MMDSEGAVSHSMDKDVSGSNIDIQKSKVCVSMNAAENVTGEECSDKLKSVEEKGKLLKNNSCDSINRNVSADPVKTGNRVERKKSEKDLDLPQIRNMVISAMERMRERMKKPLMCHEISIICSQGKNCRTPSISSVSEKESSEVKVIEGSLPLHRCPCMEFEMRAVIERRLKVIAEKIASLKKEQVIAAQKTKDSQSNPCGNNTKTVEEIRKGEESETLISEPSAELKSRKIYASLPEFLKNDRINELECSSSLSNTNKESLNRTEYVFPKIGSSYLNPVFAPLQQEAPQLEPCVGNSKLTSEVEIKDSEDSKDIVSKLIGNVTSSQKEDESLAISTKFPENIPSEINPLPCIDKDRVNQDSGESISLNVRAKEQIPVVMSEGQAKDDGTLPTLFPKLDISASPKRSLGPGEDIRMNCSWREKNEIIESVRRIKVEISEEMESKPLQNMELDCKHSSSGLPPFSMLQVNLGYRCDSPDFQKLWKMEGSNCSKDSQFCKWVKIENIDKENCSFGEVVVIKQEAAEEQTQEKSRLRRQLRKSGANADDVQSTNHVKKKRKL